MSQRNIGQARREARLRSEQARKKLEEQTPRMFVLLPDDYCMEAPCSAVDRIAPSLKNAGYALIRSKYDPQLMGIFVEDIKSRLEIAKQAMFEAFELVIVVPLGYAKEFADQAVKALQEFFDGLHIVVVQEGQS